MVLRISANKHFRLEKTFQLHLKTVKQCLTFFSYIIFHTNRMFIDLHKAEVEITKIYSLFSLDAG